MAGGSRRKHRWQGIRAQAAVSLIEVLVVISVIVLLLAMLVPSLYHAREQSRRIHCTNNLRQWGIALGYYRDDYYDYLPTEGAYIGKGIEKPNTWYNELPPYLGAPPYKDVQRLGKRIIDFPEMHAWICPAKTLTGAYKSGSGYNQFHYGMNQVLDGLGKAPDGSRDTPGFYDGFYEGPDPGGDKRLGARSLSARRFARHPNTVFMFDICPNSPAGTQRAVATMYQRAWADQSYVGRFHGDYANVLYLDGRVAGFTTDDLVTGRDFRRGDLVWDHPGLYWGWRPPPAEASGR